MSYYIAPQEDRIKPGTMVIYTIVKRLSDFKPSEGKLYRVFKSKREMKESNFVTCYRGIDGKLRKCKAEFVLRF